MSRPRPTISTITTTTTVGREEELRIFLQPTTEMPAERRRREAEEEEAALQEMQRRREENQRRREEEEAEEKKKEEEEAARKAEEERLQCEVEEAAEAERRRKIKEGKKRKAEEEKANKAKKAKVADSECLYQSISGGDHRRSGSFSQKNVGTGGDPSDNEYPGEDNDDDDDSDDDPEPSGDETPREQEACERCRRLKRVEACVPQKGKNTIACQPCHDNKQQCTWTKSVAVAAAPTRKSKPWKAKVPLPRRHETGSSRLSNLESDMQALKEGFADIAQGQQETMELVRDSAGTTDQRLQALKRRFANLEGTLVNLMRVALGVKEGEGEEQEKEAPKGLDSEEEEE
ncbi:hypothetical protein F5878DRAFT_679250 [Lentinula raphanica]|uniref:Zn(2)-C6 fungal-type domain-containing protein n=1 Tax=Lentinula raphanica TaxID=153919 RepID=A0AA38U234_9AGAR|nr:hypothetical protein F5878DRAFT_679250 [Lentinula raphanica]